MAKLYRKPWVRRSTRLLMPIRTPEKWLFLVGCYNSGTTILRRLLESHPDIAGLPLEGVDMTDAFPDLEQGGWPRMMLANRHIWSLDPEEDRWRADRAKRDWSVWWRGGAKVYLEKSIDHTVRMDWIAANFPNAHFIAIVRNGLCVNEGILRRARPRADARAEVGELYPPRMAAEQWVEINRCIMEAERNLQHFHMLRYEDLMDDPVGQLWQIFEFLRVEQPSMSLSGNLVSVENKVHELLNQNKVSLARLSETARAEMLVIIEETMLRLGYQGKANGIY